MSVAGRLATPSAAAPGPPVCLSCGYELGGLAAGALCPECAFPVARSLERSRLIRTADPAWVARVHCALGRLSWAMRTVLWFGCGVIAVGLIGTVIEYVVGLRPSAVNTVESVVAVLAFLVLCAAAGLHVSGCLGLSAGTFGGFAAGPIPRNCLRIAGLLFPLCAGYTLLLGKAMGSLPPWGVGVLRASFQAVSLAQLLALAAVLEALERGTASWNEALRQRHRNVRKNLYGLAVLIVLIFWSPVGSRGVAGGSWGESVFALAYLLMLIPVGRVRQSVGLERAIGERSDAEGAA